ncbi:MAG TPA: TetR/AcrR family transcriptional regulator [Solirubrobacteraceae bacterium]|nr:TetR/AcrR family transcriptional regulator [Solirubrobacteraceae bacterium]
MPRPKQRTPELRDHVLSAAVELLSTEGVSGFTTRSVARDADTSTPAVYELFGDRAGLLREVFFEGFRLLRRELDALPPSDDPRAELIELADVYRNFMRERPVLTQLMFSRPFADFDPTQSERDAGASVRTFIVERVGRAIDDGMLHGDATDLAHVLVALIQGLVAAENTERLGSTAESIDRRWSLAVNAMLAGLGQ